LKVLPSEQKRHPVACSPTQKKNCRTFPGFPNLAVGLPIQKSTTDGPIAKKLQKIKKNKKEKKLKCFYYKVYLL